MLTERDETARAAPVRSEHCPSGTGNHGEDQLLLLLPVLHKGTFAFRGLKCALEISVE